MMKKINRILLEIELDLNKEIIKVIEELNKDDDEIRREILETPQRALGYFA